MVLLVAQHKRGKSWAVFFRLAEFTWRNRIFSGVVFRVLKWCLRSSSSGRLLYPEKETLENGLKDTHFDLSSHNEFFEQLVFETVSLWRRRTFGEFDTTDGSAPPSHDTFVITHLVNKIARRCTVCLPAYICVLIAYFRFLGYLPSSVLFLFVQ